MVVAEHIAELVVLTLLALRDLTGVLHLRRRRDVVAKPSLETVIQDVASETVEVGGADAVVERSLRGVFTCATIVARVGITGAVGGILAFRSSERWRAQTLGTLVAGYAGPSIAAVEAATSLGVIFTCGASKTLQEVGKKSIINS